MATADTWTGFLDDASPSGYDGDSAAVGDRVVNDTDLPGMRGYDGPLRVVVSGGAGQLAGPMAFCARAGLRLNAVEVALRDPDDPAGNARRVVAAVDAARADGAVPDDVVVHVAMTGEPSYGWLAAADELGAAGLALTLPLELPSLRTWVDAALDRELVFSLAGGTTASAVDALATTARLWDGEGADLARGRRWCRSWACPDVAASLAELAALA